MHNLTIAGKKLNVLFCLPVIVPWCPFFFLIYKIFAGAASQKPDRWLFNLDLKVN